MPDNTSRAGRLTGLESLRGVAALLLVLFHARYLPPLTSPDWMSGVLRTFGSGVPLFYSISAFSLLLGYEHALDRPDGLRKFYVRRFFRIAPLFYVMMVIWLILRRYHLHVGTKGREVLIDVTFIFGLLPGHHEGLVWASWSIGVEWIFYALFPLFLLLGQTLRSATILFAVGLFISASTPKLLDNLSSVSHSFIYMCFPNHLAFFCAGILAYRLARPKPDFEALWIKSASRWLPWAILCASLLWLWIGWFSPLHERVGRAYLGVHWTTVGWLGLLTGTVVGLPWVLDNPPLRYAGRLSFGLYLTNPPVIYGLTKLGVFNGISQRVNSQAWSFLLCGLLSIAMVTLSAQLAFTFVENPGIRLGERVWQWLRSRSAARTQAEPPIPAG